MLTFREYANYGFEKKPSTEEISDSIDRELPIHKFDVEEMCTYLAMRKLGPHSAKATFVDCIVWGEEVGAVRVRVNSQFQILVEKRGIDLNGTTKWICKKNYQINREGYGGFEDAVANELFEEVQDVYDQPLDAPAADYKDLERLAIKIAHRLEQSARQIFVFENITKINNNRYIVVLGVRGQGVEAPQHMRVEENLTEVLYDEKAGCIRVFNTNVESPVGKEHTWSLSTADQDFWFFPSQDMNEMVDAVVLPIKYY